MALTILKCPFSYFCAERSKAHDGVGSDTDVVLYILLQVCEANCHVSCIGNKCAQTLHELQWLILNLIDGNNPILVNWKDLPPSHHNLSRGYSISLHILRRCGWSWVREEKASNLLESNICEPTYDPQESSVLQDHCMVQVPHWCRLSH